jgi:ribose 5-phosphate isomerase B
MKGQVKTIALASDHGGVALKNEIKQMLSEMGLEFRDYGSLTDEPCDYAGYAEKAALAVASGEAERGILFCGTGAGMNYVANKVRGVRCVLCSDCFTAAMSRTHNDANVMALGGRVLGVDLAKMIVKIWLETPFSAEERHIRRIAAIAEVERRQFSNN